MKASLQIETWQRTVTWRPSRQPWFFLSHCQKQKTTSSRGEPAGPHAEALPGLRGPNDHWPWTATPRQATTTSMNACWCGAELCHPCGKTFTILPDWLAPSGHFSLHCRQQVCESNRRTRLYRASRTALQGSARSPDPSTLRRWAHRRLISVCCWVKAGAIGRQFLRAHHRCLGSHAVCRILPIEARSP